MAKIEGLRIRNFRTLRDVILGKLSTTQNVAASLRRIKHSMRIK